MLARVVTQQISISHWEQEEELINKQSKINGKQMYEFRISASEDTLDAHLAFCAH